MNFLQMMPLPTIVFAHTFGTEEYRACLRKQPRFVEITYVAEGELYLERDGVTCVARRGDVICNLFDKDLMIHASAYHCHHTVGFCIESIEPVLPLCFHLQNGGEPCRRLIDEIIFNHAVYPEDELICTGLLLQLLGELKRATRNQASSPATGRDRYIRRAKQYIFDHMTENISQKEVADHLGITPAYLCAVFKQSEGQSVIQFVNRIKLEHIRSLMEKEGVSLKEAATTYGFADPNYVSRLYKKTYGISLTETLEGMKKGRVILPWQ